MIQPLEGLNNKAELSTPTIHDLPTEQYDGASMYSFRRKFNYGNTLFNPRQSCCLVTHTKKSILSTDAQPHSIYIIIEISTIAERFTRRLYEITHYKIKEE